MKFKRKLINQSAQLSVSQIFGAVLLTTGTLTLLIMAFVQWLSKKPDVNDISAFVAIGFFLIMLGIAFFFPDMLKSNAGNATSTMRVATYMIVSVFIFLVVKAGWQCNTLASFTLDNTWAYLMAAALGSKALQSFSENRLPNKGNTAPTEVLNPVPGNGLPDAAVPLHSQQTLKNPPPANKPDFIQ